MSDPVTTTLTSSTTNLQTELLGAGGAAVGIGAVVFALRKGWKFFRSMI
jgi:hypothetical protein